MKEGTSASVRITLAFTSRVARAVRFFPAFLVSASILNLYFELSSNLCRSNLVQHLPYLSEDPGAAIAFALWTYTVLKRDQCCLSLASMGATGFVRFNSSCAVKDSSMRARRANYSTVSNLNYDHGRKLPWQLFFNRLVEIHNKCPEEARAYIAGIIDSDGGLYVHPDRSLVIGIFQSSYPYLKALSVFLFRAYGVKSVLRMEKRGAGKMHDCWALKIHGRDDVMKMICSIGKYGVNRRIQWLVLLIVALARRADRDDYGIIVAFASDFMKFIRWFYEPS